VIVFLLRLPMIDPPVMLTFWTPLTCTTE